jgi:hypothetical protein
MSCIKSVKLLLATLALLTVVSCAQYIQRLEAKSGYVAVDHGQLFYQKFGTGDPIVVVHGGPGGGYDLFAAANVGIG